MYGKHKCSNKPSQTICTIKIVTLPLQQQQKIKEKKYLERIALKKSIFPTQFNFINPAFLPSSPLNKL